jgi:hypothetical protein
MNLADDPIAEITKVIRSRKKLETQVRGDFQSELPVLKFTTTNNPPVATLQCATTPKNTAKALKLTPSTPARCCRRARIPPGI